MQLYEKKIGIHNSSEDNLQSAKIGNINKLKIFELFHTGAQSTM